MPHTILRKQDAAKKVGLCKQHLQNLINSGEFPRPIKLGGHDSRAVGWIEAEIDAWIEKKIAERDAALAGGAA